VQYWKELRERTGVLDIMALLIMPVQRFLRHKLLLEVSFGWLRGHDFATLTFPF
jgi:hypothetical protein